MKKFKNSIFKNYKPAVPKNYLIIIAGLLWFGVGIMLISFAFKWLSAFKLSYDLIFIFYGIVVSIFFAIFKFNKFALKNLNRLKLMSEKSCAFSFISWKSYILIIIMMSFGFMLRHSSIPRQYLSVLYIGIGNAMLISSMLYFRFLFQKK